MSSKHYQMLFLGAYNFVPSLLRVLQLLLKHFTASLVAQFQISFFAATKQGTATGAML